MIVKGIAELVNDPHEITRYQRLLRPWVAEHMDHVIRIKPTIVTGIELLPTTPVEQGPSQTPHEEQSTAQ
ncbi:hypothetical protein [Nonomuraea turcica]|uniref:hypothetical protein n=1 Tax=Nonomuraea sp. G32 TaxID=3067274 RepID=UPI00273B6EEC|nr:hypothetical protein [Nonomuraea sp. G32]MDP4512170.1 hypothetical protein [Nonomuraea sp. G32]